MSDSTLDRIEETLVTSTADVREELTRRDHTDDENPSGDRQLAADVATDRLLADRFTALDGVGTYASEEREDVVDAGSGVSVAVDPLDGSSNLQSNNLMGTIVSVYDAELPASGDTLLAAYFVLYGPLTTMTGLRNGTVTEHMLEDGAVRKSGEVHIPEEPTVYGFGGRIPDWPQPIADFVGEIERELKLRYGGAMVADVNQVLSKGGIFAYPTLTSAPQGKLRLQFEGIPMAAIVEAAGGASSDGSRSLLDVQATELHQRIPVYLGNESLVDRLEDALA